MTNQEINQKLDYMLKEYGVEYHDFGFTDDMNNWQIAAIIESREMEIKDCLDNDLDNDNYRLLEEVTTIDQIQAVLRYSPISRRFVYTQMLGNTQKTYKALMNATPKDYTRKSWLALHIRWADTLSAI